ERARYRATQRRISRPRAHGEDTASMRIEGPASDVLALDTALHAAARAAKTNGDARTIDQLRFDTLTGLAHQALATGHLGCTSSHSTQNNTAGHRTSTHGCTLPLAHQHGHRPTIMITIPLNQLLPHRPPPTNTNTTSQDSPTGGPDSSTGQDPDEQIPTWPP